MGRVACVIQCGRTVEIPLEYRYPGGEADHGGIYCKQCGASIEKLIASKPISIDTIVAWAVKRTRFFAYRRRGVPQHSRRASK
jgi:hypothetical protein